MGWLATDASNTSVPALSRQRLWGICLLLLLASAINYMDRQTLSAASIRITQEFQLTAEEYGGIEARFGLGFAIGSLCFGLLVDWVSVRWLYPLALLMWSLVGFMTGYAKDQNELLWYRGLLGFFEAAHWPCALSTTLLILGERGRSMGNSVLQSGTSLGAIVTPLLMLWIMNHTTQGWRLGFQVVGLGGLFWIVAWLLFIRASDLRRPKEALRSKWSLSDFAQDLFSRRMLIALVVVAMINSSWQVLRAWLPKIMDHRGYAEADALRFNSVWYLCTDLGCLGAGYLALRLTMRGWSVRNSRIAVFALCVFACSSLLAIPWLPKGLMLLFVFLMAGAGALGLFPLYYSFTQDISKHHIGKITGLASFFGWVLSAPVQTQFGILRDRTGSYDQGLYLVVGMLWLALGSLVLFWPSDRVPNSEG